MLQQRMLALPAPPMQTLTNQTQEIIQSQELQRCFTKLCNRLVKASQNYSQTGNAAFLAEINILSPLARYPALLLFPSHHLGLPVIDAQFIASHTNLVTTLDAPLITATHVLLLKKGMLLSQEKIAHTSLMKLLMEPRSFLSEDMTRVEVTDAVRDELVERADQLRLAYQGDPTEEERVLAVSQWNTEECNNGFASVLEKDIADCCKEKFEQVKRELCLICDCEGCQQALQEGDE